MITMTSLLNTSTLVFCMCFLLVSPSSSRDQGLKFEEKTRLGSSPPSCHSKCNGCHPCMAVQVAAPLPSHYGFQQAAGSSKEMSNSVEFFEQSSASQYSNYKPLGWKCHCDHHFYNP